MLNVEAAVCDFNLTLRYQIRCPIRDKMSKLVQSHQNNGFKSDDSGEIRCTLLARVFCRNARTQLQPIYTKVWRLKVAVVLRECREHISRVSQ